MDELIRRVDVARPLLEKYREVKRQAERARNLRNLGSCLAFPPALGPTYGGWISAVSSWRMIFWLLLPFVLVSLVSVGTKQKQCGKVFQISFFHCDTSIFLESFVILL